MMRDDANHNHRITEVLRGDLVCLRPPKRDEVPFVQALWADPETMEAVGGTYPLPTGKFDRWFAYAVDPGNPTSCYCLIFMQENIPIGEISFHQWSPRDRSAVLNIKVMARHRGHGYGTDALKTFLAWFFGPAGGRKMLDDVDMDNPGGQRLLKSVGFEQVSGRDPAHDCDAADVCMLDMTREMYTAKYGAPGLNREITNGCDRMTRNVNRNIFTTNLTGGSAHIKDPDSINHNNKYYRRNMP